MTRAVLIMSLIFQTTLINAQDAETMWAVDSIGLQLSQIAWENSPLNKIHDSDVGVAKAELKSSRLTWLNGLSLGSNINEFTINPPETGNAFFPRYYFGFSLNFGQAFGTSREVKKVRNHMTRLDLSRTENILKLKSEVLRRYETYKMTEELLKISKENVISINSELTVVEQAFSEGTTDLVTYTEVMGQYSDARSNVIKASNAHTIAKINLEELLGISLEEALKKINE